MGLRDAFRNFMALTEPMETRDIDSFVDHPGLTEQLLAVQGLAPRPWVRPSIRDALGVPAIQRAVTLISATVGSLSMEGFRNGVPMTETPRLLSRPDPFSTPRDSYRDMAFLMATRGETVLWIAARDADQMALALIVVPLAELAIEENPRNRLFPIYKWGNVTSTRYSAANTTGDFVHITYLKEPGALRGVGPLQLCGAATSVAVEAQEWAANFFASGGHPSLIIKSAVQLGEAADGTLEADTLRAQWMDKPNNVPRVIDPSIESVDEFAANTQGAQMLASRDYQNGDAARMFGIPGSLLDYGVPGSSLTYQNVAEEYAKFVRTCLSPNYLEPIEQALTDLLPRSTVARFNVQGLLRADIKTRFDVYESGLKSGVLQVEEAREMEGLDPGNIEVAPVLFSPPTAIPTSLPIQTRSQEELRCSKCKRLLAELTSPPYRFTCPKCKTVNAAEAVMQTRSETSELAAAILTLASREQQVTVHPAIVNFPEGFGQAHINVSAPEVNAQPHVAVSLPEPRLLKRRIVRDEANNMTGWIEEPVEGEETA